MTPTPTRPTDTPDAPDLRVLFVHGMGTHAQGATLSEFSAALRAWLENGEPRIDHVAVSDRHLRPGDGEPARETWTLHAEDDAGKATTATWLLAESCWSNAFKPVSYLRIVGWLIGSVPWMLGDYLRGALNRERARSNGVFKVLRFLLIPIYALLGALLSGPTIVFLALCLVFQLIDVPLRKVLPGWLSWVSRLSAGIATTLSKSLGDVYVILATQADRESIRERIVRDHDWVSGHNPERTVVVAHSAGAALTHELIAEGRLGAFEQRTYVTLGEAAWRMLWMSQLSATRKTRIAALVMAIAATLLVVLGFVALARNLDEVGVISMIAGVLLHVGSALFVWRAADTRRARKQTLDALTAKVDRWHDYVGSSDPVPAGALTAIAHGPSVDTATSYEPMHIRNARSIAFDHTGYTKNLEEFVSPLAVDLDGAAASPLGLTAAPAEAVQARKLRTLTLALVRLGSAAVGATVLLALAFGGDALRTLGHELAWLQETAGGVLPDWVDDTLTDGRVGVVIAFVLLVAPWATTRFVGWGIWAYSDRKRLLARRAAASHPGPHLAIAAGWLTLSSAAVFATFSLADVKGRPSWIAAGVALLLGALMLALVKPVATWRDRIYSRNVGATTNAVSAAGHAQTRDVSARGTGEARSAQ